MLLTTINMLCLFVIPSKSFILHSFLIPSTFLLHILDRGDGNFTLPMLSSSQKKSS